MSDKETKPLTDSSAVTTDENGDVTGVDMAVLQKGASGEEDGDTDDDS